MLKIASCLVLFLAVFTTLYSSDLDWDRLRQNISKENNLLENNVVVHRGKDILNISILVDVKNCKLDQLKMLNSRDKYYCSIMFYLPSGTFPRLSFAVINPKYRPNENRYKYDFVGVTQTKDEQIDISGLSSIKMSNFNLNLFDPGSLNKLESNQYVKCLYITYKKKNSFDCNILEKFPKLESFRGTSINKFKNPESLKKYKIHFYSFNNCNDYIFLSTINTKSSVIMENMKVDGKLASKYLNQRNSPLDVAFENCKISDIDILKKSSNLSGLCVNGVIYKSIQKSSSKQKNNGNNATEGNHQQNKQQ